MQLYFWGTGRGLTIMVCSRPKVFPAKKINAITIVINSFFFFVFKVGLP